ncbi:hypothetical protein GSI_08352 [Ganoderma sinense ZZ0214-1]|uniref:Uncharacterized protein n=1 Tax=Ganoderma sinense ZZ0214-1 TaxID=1077348 RepID=A0A2G8S725_9APHY|nr:hypothetical protein GSI_08352 [Ganoderma sinense ZZ0214-1]
MHSDSDTTAHTEMDTLIAALHPHIAMSLFKYNLYPPRSLGPRKDTDGSLELARAFATLFRFHPGCSAAAVAARPTVAESRARSTSFSVCLSPSTPPDFESSLAKWLAQLRDLREESESMDRDSTALTFSPSEERFILYTYGVCYPAMHRLIKERGFGSWISFVKERKPVPGYTPSKPTVEEAELAQKYADEIRAFSGLVRGFAERVAHESLGEDGDVLRFHKLCVAIRDMRSNDGFLDYLDTYVRTYLAGSVPRQLGEAELNYISPTDYGVIQPRLAYFHLPLAVSTIIALCRDKKISLDDLQGWALLDPLKGARRFSAVIEESYLAEHFGKERGIRWKAVVEAFNRRWAVGPMGYDMGYQLDAGTNTMSTARLVVVHPEIALIQHLLDSEGGENPNLKRAKAHIACSRTPCYATGAYAVAVNQAFGTRFTMDVDDPDWCRLDDVEPWILPENAPEGVVAKTKESLLEDLGWLIVQWMGDTGFSTVSSDDVFFWE